MTRIDKACYERGCACHDDRVDGETIEVVQREWRGLTEEERGITAAEIWGSVLIAPQSYQAFARAIEARLKEKNT